MGQLHTRRGFLTTAAATVGAIGTPSLLAACGDDSSTEAGAQGGRNGRSGSLQKISVMLDWRWDGKYAGVFAAQREGFFADEGLDVNFLPPASGGDSLKFVAARAVELGFAYTADHAIAAENVPGVISIAEFIRINDFGIGALKGFGLTGPESLRGKTVALASLPVTQVMFDAFLESGGVTRDDMELIISDFGLEALLTEGDADAIVNVDFGMAKFTANGLETEFIYFSDFGVPEYPFALVIANQDYLESNPEVATGFLRALWKGMDSALEDPAPAWEWGMAQDSALELKTLQAMWDAISPQMSAGDRGYGVHDFDGIQALIDFLVDREVLSEPQDAHDLATDDFLP